MTTPQIGPLDQDEIKVVPFRFEKELPAGVTLDTAAVTVSMTRGADATPAQLLVGVPVVSGTSVLQKVTGSGRSLDAVYHLRARAVDSDGLAHVIAADLPLKRL